MCYVCSDLRPLCRGLDVRAAITTAKGMNSAFWEEKFLYNLLIRLMEDEKDIEIAKIEAVSIRVLWLTRYSGAREC